jgi:hypothetical protein
MDTSSCTHANAAAACHRWLLPFSCKCRFEDAHTARLAYDQVIVGLGLCKPTNYHPGTQPLDNPDVEAKLQEYFIKNPAAAAAAAAAAAKRTGSQQHAASAPVPAAAVAETSRLQQVLDGAPESAGVAAGGVDVVAACVAELAAFADAGLPVAVIPADSKADNACAATAAATRKGVSSAQTKQQLLGVRSASSSSTACTTSMVNVLISRAGSETCSSEHPATASNMAAAYAGSSSGNILLLQPQPCTATNSAIQPSAVLGTNTVAAVTTEELLSKPPTNKHVADTIHSPGSLLGAMSLDTFGLTPADSMKPLPHLQGHFADLMQLPVAPHLQLCYDESPFAQQEQEQEQQQPEQHQHHHQQQQLAYFHSLLGPLHSFKPALPTAAPTAAAAAAAAGEAAAAGGHVSEATAAAEAAPAGVLVAVPASEILAAWIAAQTQQQHEYEAPLEAATLYASEPPPADSHPASWLTPCSDMAGDGSGGSAFAAHAETHRAKRARTVAAEELINDSGVLTAAQQAAGAGAGAAAAGDPQAASAWPAAVAAAAAWLSDAAASAAARGIS